MQWYALLPFVALASALTQQEQQAHSQYYSNHRRPCGEAQFSVLSGDAQNYTLRTTGIPQHAAFRTSPFRAAIQELVYNFPRDPVPLDRPLCVPNGVPIGFALDGVPFYSPLSKDWNNAIEGSCAQVYDRCGGTVDKNNQYYYSGLPNFAQSCLDVRSQESVHIGTALDGFPIYFERRFNGSALDECGGRYVDTTNKLFYRYVVSENFPYTIGCFRGRVHNISTLTYCKGHKGEYGSLCACVNVGPPGMAVGYKWLSKDAVTVGQCMRRPIVGERERALICNRDAIPAPDFLIEDRRSKTCVDFQALYSLIVIQGHQGGLAPWTRLWNYGKEEDMEEREEDNEYIRHFKALRWLLSDLNVLDYPALEKYDKNKTRPLCPREQRELRNTLAQIWVVAFLREAYKWRPEASEYEKEEADRAFRRLTYVLKTLKAMEITAFVKKPERKPMDPWGIWTADEEEDDDKERMKRDEDKFGALISQLTALQTLGQMKEREKKEKKSDGEDRNKDIRARLLYLLWEIQDLSVDGKYNERGSMRRGGERGGRGGYGDRARGEAEDMEEYGGKGWGRPGKGKNDCNKGYEMREEEMECMRMGSYGMGRRGRYQRQGGYRSMEGEGGEGMEGRKSFGRGGYCGMEAEGGRKEGDYGWGRRGDGDCEEEEQRGDRPEPRGGYGQDDQGRWGGDGRGRDCGYGPPWGGRYDPPRGGRDGPPWGGRDGPPRGGRSDPPRDGRDGPPRAGRDGPPWGGRDGPPSGGRYGPPRGGRDGPPRGGRDGPPRGGRDGPPRGGRDGPPWGGRDGPPMDGRDGPPRGGRDGPPRGGRDGPPRGGRDGPPRGGRDGPPAWRRYGGDAQCPACAEQDQDGRDEVQGSLDQFLQLISYLRGDRDDRNTPCLVYVMND